MRIRLALAITACALSCAAPAAADTTTLLEPPARSPVTIAGTDLKRGDRLTGDQILMRRVTSVVVPQRRTIRLRCPDGHVHAGLGFFDPTRIYVRALNRYPGRRVARIEVFAPGERGQTVRGSVFALCVSPAR